MPNRRIRRLLLPVAVVFAAAACGTSAQTLAPTPAQSTGQPAASVSFAPASGSADSSDQAVYAGIEAQIEALRELQRKNTVRPVLLDSTGMRDWLTKANEAQTDHAAAALESKLFVHLGLLPAGSSLEQMTLDLQAGQVVGFYDPDSKGLYVLSEAGGVGPTQRITFSHEYTHALQDQVFGLDKLGIDTTDQGDRNLARLALVEGDATLAMTKWAATSMSIPDLMAVAGDSGSAAQTEQLARAPAILRETLLFPYEDGLIFVQSLYDKGGWAAVDAMYADPPDSTSQILHPDLYASKLKPVEVAVPTVPASLGGAWKLTMQDTLGELQLRIWLAGENPSNAATTAAASAVAAWGGDRAALYEGPNGAWAVVLKTTWRSATGAQAFDAAAGKTLAALTSPSRTCAGPGTSVAIVIASDQTVIPQLGVCR